jgi:hypothetical protein
MDRVLRSGVAYEFEEGDDGSGVPDGLLTAEISRCIQHIQPRPLKGRCEYLATL